MRVSLEIGEDTIGLLVPALVEAAKKEGLLISKPETDDPLTVGEVSRRSTMSESQVRKMINEGIFERVALTGRVLITADSFDRWKKGGSK
jgi:hypothetical protein